MLGVSRSTRNRRSVSITVVLLIAVVVTPQFAYAYGDPTGGQLFQILAPLLAVIWGAWLIFANNVRKRVGSLFRWMRGAKPEDAAVTTDSAGPTDHRPSAE
jgi:hypothetical protein